MEASLVSGGLLACDVYFDKEILNKSLIVRRLAVIFIQLESAALHLEEKT